MTTPGLMAKKIGMTRMVDGEGQMTAVTLLQVEAQKVTKVLNAERDGYNALQLGYATKREKHLNKSDVARLRKVGVEDNFARFKEFRLDGAAGEGQAIGTLFGVKILDGVKQVDVTGMTKGRGFSGAHRRWNAAVCRMTHGSMYHRRPGSLGCRSTPGRVMKNKHMPGCYGDEQVTVQNLQVLDIDTENNVVAIRGSVPGHRDGFLIIRPSVKTPKAKGGGAKNK
jgi:large subunit ribosomal protein L3